MSITATQIQTAYVVFFGRPADPDGLAFWQDSYNGRYVVEVQSVLPVGTGLADFDLQTHVDAAAAALRNQVNLGTVAGANFLIVMYDVEHDAALFRFQDLGTPGIQANELSLVGLFNNVGIGWLTDAHFA